MPSSAWVGLSSEKTLFPSLWSSWRWNPRHCACCGRPLCHWAMAPTQEQEIFKSLFISQWDQDIEEIIQKKKKKHKTQRWMNLKVGIGTCFGGQSLAIPWNSNPALSLATNRLIESKLSSCFSSWSWIPNSGRDVKDRDSRWPHCHVSRLTFFLSVLF